MCAPGVLSLLEPYRGKPVLELGCGSGLLTKYLVEDGHRVIATDASPAMLDLARGYAAGAERYDLLAMPHDRMPPVSAIISIGHPISYLDTEREIDEALVAMAIALLPGGLMALDICDLEWGIARKDQPTFSKIDDDWAIITRFSQPPPNKYVREMATFLRNEDGSWRRSDERHDNVLVETSRIPALLAKHGIDATVQAAFGSEQLPVGLKVVVGCKP